MISEQLVKKLNLKTTPQSKPYPLGWLKKDTKMQVTAHCTFKFSINGKYMDQVTCDVVPLEVCHIVLGSPYLWDRDATYLRRENIWKLVKDGKRFHILASKEKKKLQLLAAQHLVNTNQKFSLLTVRQAVKEPGELICANNC